MQLHDVAILGFRLNAPEPPEKALVRVFRIEPQVARTMLKSFPVVVKHGVPLDVARSFEAALVAIGARVEVRLCVPQAAPGAQPAPLAQPAPPHVAPVMPARDSPARDVAASPARATAAQPERPSAHTVMQVAPLPQPAPAQPASPMRAATQFMAAPLRDAPAATRESVGQGQRTMLQADFAPMLAEARAAAQARESQAARERELWAGDTLPPLAGQPAASPPIARAPGHGLGGALGELDLGGPSTQSAAQPSPAFAQPLDSAQAFGAPLTFDTSSFDFDTPPSALTRAEPANLDLSDEELFAGAPLALAGNAPPTPTPADELQLADDGLPLELAIPMARTQDISAALAAVPRELLIPPSREALKQAPANQARVEPARAKPQEPAAKPPAFGVDLALPWLDAEVQRAASVRPPAQAPSEAPAARARDAKHAESTDERAGAPRTRGEALALAHEESPFAVRSPGPVPIPPSRELSAQVAADLPQDAEGFMLSLGVTLLVFVLAMLSFAAGWALMGTLLVLLAGLVGMGAGAYAAVRRELAAELEPLSSRAATHAELYARGYDRWARHHGFEPLRLYRRLHTRELMAVFEHERVPAYLIVRLTPRGVFWELLSVYEREHRLITTSAGYVLPPVPRCFRQSYTASPLQRLLSLHGEAHDYLRIHAKLEPARDQAPFEARFASLQAERERALEAVPLWMLWLLPWRAVLPHQLGEQAVTKQH